MAFQAGCLISVVLGRPDLEMEIRPYNVRRDLRSLLQTLLRHPSIVGLKLLVITLLHGSRLQTPADAFDSRMTGLLLFRNKMIPRPLCYSHMPCTW